jgi:hypothetical protein
MGLFSFMAVKTKTAQSPGISANGHVECNNRKTQLLLDLFQIPADKRNGIWRLEFYRHAKTAALMTAEPELMTGRDGFTYFVLRTPEKNEHAFEPVCIHNIKDDILLKKGYGVLINPADHSAEWIFSYGDIVNLHLRQEFVSREDHVAGIGNIDMRKRLQVLKQDEQIMVAQPAESYLPKEARATIKRFLQSKGIKRPMVMLLCRKENGQHTQELVFNIHAENFVLREDHETMMEQIAWFLPDHYRVAAVSANSNMVKYLAEL